MAGLDCPMQTKAFNLFWHKAELRLLEQVEPEAPVFAISRPTLFGGREEFLLQYPARLERPTDRDIARHRFKVRHGKKRRSFQAPDAATFETWLSALKQALEPERNSERSCHTPSTTTSTANTATSSQGGASASGSYGINSQSRVCTVGSSSTHASSRGRASSLASDPSSQRSHASQPRAPALRLTLEWPCFTRDPNNLKVIRLHRPAATIIATATTEVDDDVLNVADKVEEEQEEEILQESEEVAIESVMDSKLVQDEVGNVVADEDTLTDKCLNVANRGFLEVVGDDIDLTDSTTNSDDLQGEIDEASVVTLEAASLAVQHGDVETEVAAWDNADIEADLAKSTASTEAEADNIEPEVKSAVEALRNAVREVNASIAVATCTSGSNGAECEAEVKFAGEALVAAGIKTEDNATVKPSTVVAVVSPTAPRSFKMQPAPKSSTRSARLATKHKWAPLDPNNSMLLWVRCSVEVDVKSAPRSNPKRNAIKAARGWVPMEPNSTRFIWIRRVEHTPARIESRYKPTSNTRKWIPLDSDNSRFLWIRRQVVPVATSRVGSSTSRLYRHGKQRRH